MGLFRVTNSLRVISLATVLTVAFSTSGCSWFGGSGSGSPEDYDLSDESNIPLASRNGDLDDVNFDYDSSSLSESAKQTLKKNAQWLLKNNVSNVVIEGHCDERGTADYNLALGERRARSAMEYVKSLGVAGSKLSIVSYGAEIPLDPSHTEAAYAKNRRAHFSVSK